MAAAQAAIVVAERDKRTKVDLHCPTCGGFLMKACGRALEIDHRCRKCKSLVHLKVDVLSE